MLHKAALRDCSKTPSDQYSLGEQSPREVVCANQYIDLMVLSQDSPTELGTLATGKAHLEFKKDEENMELDSVGVEHFFSKDLEQQHNPKIVVAVGVAGVGKTTVVQKLTYDWASGRHYGSFAFVFPFEFRKLNLIEEEMSLATLVIKQHAHLVQDAVREALQSPESVLFLLDGLDQYHHGLDFTKTQLCSDPEKVIPMPQLVASLMSGILLKGSSVLVTTRPTAALVSLREVQVDRYLEIFGFHNHHRKAYFDRFFEDTRLADEAFRHIEKNDFLSTLCYNPSFCWIICCALKVHFSAGECPPETLTHVLASFTTSLLLSKGEPAPRDLILRLGKMAVHGIRNGTGVVSKEEMATFDIQPCHTSPVLSTFLHTEGGALCRTASFVHPTIQEFLAACSFFLHPSVNMEELLEKPQEFLDVFLVGLSTPLVRKPLETILGEFEREPLQKTQNWLKQTTQQAMQAWDKDEHLRCFHLLYHSQSESLIREVFQKPVHINASYATLSLLDCTSIAYVVSSCGNVEKLQLMGTSLTEAMTSRLTLAFSCSEKIGLAQCRLPGESCAHLASALSSGKTKHLELTYNRDCLGDTGAKLLCAGLRDPNCKLHTLLLGSCGLSEQSGEDLASALSAASSELRELELRGNALQDQGVIRLSAGLSSPNCKLQSLSLDHCELTADFGEHLASALRSAHSAVRTLQLRNNELGDSGFQGLTAALQDPNCKLEQLFVNDCSLTTASCAGLARALRSQACRLTELDLSVNDLYDQGVAQLCGALKHRGCKLEKLRLARCELTSGCCEDLALVLRYRSSRLRELELGVNPLKDEGVKVLWGALKDHRCKLEHLGVELASLTDACVDELTAALRVNRSLKYIELKNNNLTDASIPEILKVFQDSPTLQKINVRYNNFSEEALMMLDECDREIEY
ncbi:NACHT, LRR and PYD domains-containing protein 12 isoform X2 [Amia ocellicauda]